MLDHPIFKPHYHIEIVPGEGILLLTEQGIHTIIHGTLYERIALLLGDVEKNYTSDGVATLLIDEFNAAEVYYGLLQLQDRGYIIERTDHTSPSAQAFWTQMGLLPKKLQKYRLKIYEFGKHAALSDLFCRIIQHTESLEITSDEQADLHIVITDSYLSPELIKVYQKLQADNRPWLLVKPQGSEAWIGPLFLPGQEGCYLCLIKRLMGNRPVDRFFFEKGQNKNLSLSRGFLPVSIGLAYHYVALEIERFFRGDQTLQGKVLSIDYIKRSTQIHMLAADPQCTCCRNQTRQKEENTSPPFIQSFASQQTTFMKTEAGYRTIPAEETIQCYEHLVSPISGIVSELRAHSQDPIFVYMSGFNQSESHGDFASLKKHFRYSTSGKGLTKIQAKASALCEALERYSGSYQGYEGKIRASFCHLGDAAISPVHCMLFSEKQYQSAQQWGQLGRFARVPVAFDEEAQIEWTPVWSLNHGCYKYLPTQYLYYGYFDKENPQAERYCFADSNGCASGNTLGEAILQGFLELVEHDATAMWWYNRLNKPRIDIASFDHPPLLALVKAYQAKNREVWAIDLTNDFFNIPTFAAISRKIDSKKGEQIIFGFGCHPDASIALSRALAEMGQMFVSAHDLSMNLEDIDPATAKWLSTATVETQPYLLPQSSYVKCKQDYPVVFQLHLEKLISSYRLLCEQKGMEFLVLDQTRPEVGLAVVKVIVPGMRHVWPRIGPGRLYDIPVQMGWLSTPLKESELNPIPLFF